MLLELPEHLDPLSVLLPLLGLLSFDQLLLLGELVGILELFEGLLPKFPIILLTDLSLSLFRGLEGELVLQVGL